MSWSWNFWIGYDCIRKWGYNWECEVLMCFDYFLYVKELEVRDEEMVVEELLFLFDVDVGGGGGVLMI